MRQLLRKFRQDPSGATSIEYALIATLISVAIVGAVTVLGTKTTAMYEKVEKAMPEPSEDEGSEG